jgi:hypothetical protein
MTTDSEIALIEEPPDPVASGRLSSLPAAANVVVPEIITSAGFTPLRATQSAHTQGGAGKMGQFSVSSYVAYT